MLHSNCESKKIFSNETENQPTPKITFINEYKIEFQDECFKFSKYFLLFFIFIFILFFLIGSIKLIIKGNWGDLTKGIIIYILIYFVFFRAFFKYFSTIKYLEFDKNDMKLKVKQKYLIKTKVISYNLNEIKYFTHFIEEEYGHFKIIYNDKEEEIFELLGD